MDLSFLPGVHAGLNTLVAILLVSGVILIKRGNREAHKRAVTAAMVTSMLFLLGYVTYHFTHPETSFGGQGPLRFVYYGLLASHIILAAVSFPFILFTWMYGFTGQYDRHRKFARWVFPVWLYVAVTGPVCYLLLRPYY